MPTPLPCLPAKGSAKSVDAGVGVDVPADAARFHVCSACSLPASPPSQEAKAALRELVELPLRHGGLLSAYGLPPPRGALLYGPPGATTSLALRARVAARAACPQFLLFRLARIL